MNVAANTVSAERFPADARQEVVPWHCLAVVLGAACIPIGVLWDISWHSTIGRDTFWTPAHIVIYLGGVVPGLSCGWLAFKTTFFGTEEERAASVKLFGARAPLGAWVTIWGALAMLTSAPFDDWWHNAYGLDVQIISPPHSVLAAGIFSVALGSLLLVLAWQNRAGGIARQQLALLFTLMIGLMVAMNSVWVTEESFPNQQHGITFYIVCILVYLPLLVTAPRASARRWSATIAAVTYMVILCGMIWTLPLFAATPKLAPIYRNVTHMVPPAFPLLLVVPALAIDLIMSRWPVDAVIADAQPSRLLFRRGWWKEWLLAAALGTAFLGLLLLVQWNFSKFLLSDAANNGFFAREGHWPYYAQMGEWGNRFWEGDRHPAPNVPRLAATWVLALLAARFGLWQGDWMKRVCR